MVAMRLCAATGAALCLLLGACGRTEAPAPAPQIVVAAHAQLRDGARARSFAGEVRARFETPLSFRIDGRILHRHVQLGDHVRSGQVLAELDPADTQAALAASRAALAAAQTRLEQARTLHERNTTLGKEELVSRTEREQSDADFTAAQALVEQRSNELALAANQARYCLLSAEHDGTVGSIQSEAGAVVRAGQAVLTLEWDGDRDAVIDVPEDGIGAITPGQAARVTLPADPARTFDARVREIAASADPATRSYRARLTLAGAAHVALGMTAQVTLRGAPAPAQWTLPASALFHDGAEPAVWVVPEPSHALALRRVRIARYETDAVVLAAGIDAQDLVVLQGVHTVSAGQIVQAVAPTPEGARP